MSVRSPFTLLSLLLFLLIVASYTAGNVPPTTAAASYVVNSTADAGDFLVGNGICETAPGSGNCTLRAAIQEANADPAMDVITFEDMSASPDLYTLTIGGTGEDAAGTGDLDITEELDIIGLGSEETVVQAGLSAGTGIDRVFHVLNSADVRFDSLTIRYGDAPGENGGGLRNDGAGSVIINNSIVAENEASHGGGLLNEFGTISFTNSELVNNTAGNQGGGIFNTAFGLVNFSDSTISGNDATGDSGGGIFNEDGTVDLLRSTVSLNEALSGHGAGILSGGVLTVTNSTLSQNLAGVNGGGLFNVSSPSGNVAFTNSTLSLNQAASGGGLYNDGGNISYVNTIIANHPAGGDCFSASGTLISLDHNLDSDGSCNLVQLNDLPSGNADLGPLQDNGGPTHTHALLDSSEAIDAGDSDICPPEDQRGMARPQGAACDIGAYEFVYQNYLGIVVKGGP